MVEHVPIPKLLDVNSEHFCNFTMMEDGNLEKIFHHYHKLETCDGICPRSSLMGFLLKNWENYDMNHMD